MDVVGLERAVIAGHSFGATVAQRFALDFPQRVVGLVLEGAFLPRPGNVAVRELWDEVSRFAEEVDPAFVREFQRSTLARPVPDEFFETVVGESLKMPAHVWKAVLEPFRSTDFAADLAALRAPTLIVWGDRDAFTGKVDQKALQGAIAGSRLEIYTGTGHSPHWEEPERYASQLVSFVRQLE
jgi:pimeloyl-ACP methyl ester carboxylesterase